MSEFFATIDHELAESFEDLKLSKSERQSFRTLFEEIKHDPELLSYTRNKAFDVFRSLADNESSFDSEALISASTWLERIIKTLDAARQSLSVRSSEAFFSPGTECARAIKNALQTAHNRIDICVFTISDNEITDAILHAHENGREVRVVSDNDKANDAGSDIFYLASKGVPVRLDQSEHHMHHKFAVVDSSVLINGSFNWTRSASTSNEENITLSYEKNLIKQFANVFNDLWQESLPVTDARGFQ